MAETLKKYRKIPIHIVEEHNEALQHIYAAIGGKKLPIEGNVLLHLDAHPDMLLDRKLKGEVARRGREALPLLQIENWILPAVAAGFINHVIWLRPPWAKQFENGTRSICVGDDPHTGFLRVDSKEPYYLSDALYSSALINERLFTFDVVEMFKDISEGFDQQALEVITMKIDTMIPYILDIDLDMFSTSHPFKNLYQNIALYDRLLPIFDFNFDNNMKSDEIDDKIIRREKQLLELEKIFLYLETHNNLEGYTEERSDLFQMVNSLVPEVVREAELAGESPDWYAVYAAGCTRDQGGLPYFINTESQIQRVVDVHLKPLLRQLPPPTLITIARSAEDGYCPPHQVDFIQTSVVEALQEIYTTENPFLHYLKNSNDNEKKNNKSNID